jgi:hypothetical protein
MRRGSRYALWFSLIAFNAYAGDERAPPPHITAEQALAAYDRFKGAPEQNLKEAPIFLNFMQGGEVHTVLNSSVVFWMYRAIAPDAQAVLYAAYMGGNLDSQLRGAKHGDDPEAGMRAALKAYAGLKQTHPTLSIPEFTPLANAEATGKLSDAVSALIAPKH